MIEGLSHMTFIVRDLDEMNRLLVDVLGAEEVYSSGEVQFSVSSERFFLLNGIWIAIMEGDPLTERSYNHVAFKIADDDFELHLEKLRAAEFEVKPPRPRVEGEGRSIYFYDRDNHLFELHTGTLGDRLARYAKGREAAE
ncbi:FosX/FosE/FosI family fosfomycin resistance thiol transferase [Aliihoeflea aestuarii]|jgi:fosfomycin resistance protein FosX|uniref:FosX/FosE/FosI family fosfomycin resistance hydrolase n=1 Tax=Aliihoeflea aestuarii TaxID=453840 RepID=UPI0020931FBB|nr:FosX/FosE/FosI family fosfomycin resistance hydrolase [Aliihoeflea aestuarii]MCO6390619.1 FosX/FosE/FosI family fosfomycin resistance thiol transferase [Aliihoeflea aestuarii]